MSWKLSLIAVLASGCTLEARINLLAKEVAFEDGISETFDVTTRTVDVLDSTMETVDIGEGSPIVFVHGNPTYSYTWRNVLPHVERDGRRVVAPDLIGHGFSGKPDIAYTLQDHAAYFAVGCA